MCLLCLLAMQDYVWFEHPACAVNEIKDLIWTLLISASSVVCLRLVRRWQCLCSIRRWWRNTRSSRRTRLSIRWKEECSSWPDCVILVSWPCSTLWKSPGDYHSFIKDENESEPKERVSTSEEHILERIFFPAVLSFLFKHSVFSLIPFPLSVHAVYFFLFFF